jgi:serine/threonine protein kinase
MRRISGSLISGKPENIMLRHDGYVKVLDFGLAKQTGPPGIPTDTRSPRAPEVQTSAGVLMGTTNYMSPEQARGLVVDQRTDIFSLGVVIYEMITGRPPFEGETNSDVIASILHHEPPPLAHYSREAPEALERIVTKALRKSREERYQTGMELAGDLRSLKRRLEIQPESERTVQPVSSDEPTIDRTGQPMVDAGQRSAQGGDVAARKTSSAISRHKFAFAAVAFLAAAFIGLNLSQVSDRLTSLRAPAPIRSLAVLPLVNLSGDPGQDHFADGMTDALIAHLCQIGALRVISRTSSMSD